MESKAVLKNVGISTKKARIPAEVVRGMKVFDALTTLRFMQKGAAAHVAKVIKSAVANAQNKDGANPQDLYIAEIRVDKGKGRIRHYHPRAKGGGYYMWLRGKSHITVVLKDRNSMEAKPSKPEVKKADKTEEVKSEAVEEKKVAKTTKSTAKKPAAKKSAAKAKKPSKAK